MLAVSSHWSWSTFSLFFWHNRPFSLGLMLMISNISTTIFFPLKSLHQLLFCSLLSYSRVLFKELLVALRNARHIWHVWFTCICFFTPSSRKGLCMQSNTSSQEAFVCTFFYMAFYILYICCVLGWKEFHFLAVISFHRSSLCVLRNLSPSHVLYNVFHQTFFGGNTDLPSPSLRLFLSLFAEHLRSLLSIKKDYCMEDCTDVTLGINLGSSIGFGLPY